MCWGGQLYTLVHWTFQAKPLQMLIVIQIQRQLNHLHLFPQTQLHLQGKTIHLCQAPQPPQQYITCLHQLKAPLKLMETDTDSEDLENDMLASPPRPYSPDLQKDLVDVLKEFRGDNLDLTTHVTVVARRRRVLHSACVALHKSYFEWHRTPNIEFVGEMAEDYGGPRREFFRILMSEVHSSLGIFEGKPGNLLFAYNQDALQQNKYYTAGKLTAWSILHNGPGIKCLNQHLFEMMCGRSQTIDLSKFDLETFHDTDVQHRLEKILQCKTTAEMLEVKIELGDWIAECGIPNIYSASLADFPAIYQQIITHYMYHRVSSMIQQFIAGMNACGKMWQVVQRNWETFAPLFTHTTKKLSRNDMRGLFDIKWSSQGSNKRDHEEDTIFLWEWWLMSIENNELDVTLEDILIFVTGADSVPHWVFHTTVKFSFMTKNLEASDFHSLPPVPSFCTCQEALQKRPCLKT